MAVALTTDVSRSIGYCCQSVNAVLWVALDVSSRGPPHVAPAVSAPLARCESVLPPRRRALKGHRWHGPYPRPCGAAVSHCELVVSPSAAAASHCVAAVIRCEPARNPCEAAARYQYTTATTN